METFTQSDLVYQYNWSQYPKNDPKVSGPPDQTTFQRTQGPEVLYLINTLADHLAWDVRSFGKRLEHIIHDQLPEEVNTQEDTIEWIREHWVN